MAKPARPKRRRKTDWILTEAAFARLLQWIDQGDESNGLHYMEIRRRLVTYFESKSCIYADELADETMLRVARRLDEEGSITIDAPAHYCYIVARFVFLESLKRPQSAPLEEDYPVEIEAIDEIAAVRWECFERCMEQLDREEQDLIVAYYRGDEHERISNRRKLCSKLRLTLNAVSIRACRIRAALDQCIHDCLERGR